MRNLLILAALGLGLTAAVPAAADHLTVGVGIRAGDVAVQGYGYGRDGGYNDYGYRDNDRRGWRHGQRWLDRDDVQRRLYRAGYVRIYNVDRYGDVYNARAVNGRGVLFALTVDARDGDILRVYVIGRERYRRW